MNPLRYVNDWKTVAFTGVICTAIVLVFVFAGPDERLSLLTTLGIIGTAVAASMRAAFAAPAQTPKRIELPRKSDDDDDGDAGKEVLVEEPPTTPHRPPPVRVNQHAMLALAGGIAIACAACSPSALQSHATTALIARHALEMTHDAIGVTCTTLAHECADDACLAAREADCAAASHAQEAAVAAVLTYADAIELAALADEGQVMATLRFALEAAARAWTEAGQRLATIGITIPAIGGL